MIIVPQCLNRKSSFKKFYEDPATIDFTLVLTADFGERYARKMIHYSNSIRRAILRHMKV